VAPSNVTRLPTAAKRRVRNKAVAVEDKGNVVIASMVTSIDLPVERVLHQASNAGLTEAVVVGYDADGEFYFGGSLASGPDALWLLEKARAALLDMG
jgi:hypothetical protein